MEHEADNLIARLESEAHDPDAWENDDVPAERERGLATTITVRLDAHTATRLRERASAEGVGYTTLLRKWVQERLAAEDQRDYLVVAQATAYVAEPATNEQQGFSFYAHKGTVSKAI